MALKALVLSLLICSMARKMGSPGWAAGLLGTGACGSISREIPEPKPFGVYLSVDAEASEGHSLSSPFAGLRATPFPTSVNVSL